MQTIPKPAEMTVYGPEKTTTVVVQFYDDHSTEMSCTTTRDGQGRAVLSINHATDPTDLGLMIRALCGGDHP